MKILFFILFFGDSSEIRQEVFPSLGKYALLTTDGAIFDNVIHGSLEFINRNKAIEFNRALERRKPVKLLKVKCKI